jgi:hypothetical protein
MWQLLNQPATRQMKRHSLAQGPLAHLGECTERRLAHPPKSARGARPFSSRALTGSWAPHPLRSTVQELAPLAGSAVLFGVFEAHPPVGTTPGVPGEELVTGYRVFMK